MAQAVLDVAKHYPIRGLDEKTIAWFNLSQIVIISTGAKIMAVRTRHAQENATRASRQAPRQPPVTPQPHQANGATVQSTQQAPPQEKPAQPLPRAERTGEIPGVGNIEFPADHPLAGGPQKPKLN